MSITPISFNNVRILSKFWSSVIDTVATTTVALCLDKCEETGRLDNFRKAAGRKEGNFEGTFFNDSDVYKVLEGAAYCLMQRTDPLLEKRVDEVIDDICAAQQADGYINTYYTLTDPDRRWTDMGMHEDYCIGHLIEAAVAYHQATGKGQLLTCAIRAAKHMMDVFGPDKRHWVVGHEEPELALVRLWRHTSDQTYLDFAKWLLSERGKGYTVSAHHARYSFIGEYNQDDVPVEDARRVVGHAVRAMYLYTAMADIAGIDEESPYKTALYALWNNVVPANMYITGGIGQSSSNEGFTRDYHKPNLTAYCESCASIGMAFWNHRMSLLAGESCFADIVEKEIYNGILSGISLSGDRFFYENPLASLGKHHRSAWFGCSCCPTNLVRFLPSVGGYCYSTDEESIYINQYIESEIDSTDEIGTVSLNVTTEYPWNGKIQIMVKALGNRSCLKLRIPAWCKGYHLEGAKDYHEEKGYLAVPVVSGDHLVLNLDMPAIRVYEDERVLEDRNRVCVMRGPVVYCAEEVDQPVIPTEYFPAEVALPVDSQLEIAEKDENLRDAVVIRAGKLRLIPYFSWDNRSSGGMAVWLKEVSKKD